MSQNSNNSKWMALCWGGGAWTGPALSQPVRKGFRSFTESERSIHRIGIFQFHDSIAIRQSHTASETTSRTKQNKRKGTEQSYNKPPPQKKKEPKREKNKIKIHNTQCQITNPLRYNNISKWEEFKNNSCSLYRGTERIMELFFSFFLKRLKRGNPAPYDAMGTTSQRGKCICEGSAELPWRQESPPTI